MSTNNRPSVQGTSSPFSRARPAHTAPSLASLEQTYLLWLPPRAWPHSRGPGRGPLPWRSPPAGPSPCGPGPVMYEAPVSTLNGRSSPRQEPVTTHGRRASGHVGGGASGTGTPSPPSPPGLSFHLRKTRSVARARRSPEPSAMPSPADGAGAPPTPASPPHRLRSRRVVKRERARGHPRRPAPLPPRWGHPESSAFLGALSCDQCRRLLRCRPFTPSRPGPARAPGPAPARARPQLGSEGAVRVSYSCHHQPRTPSPVPEAGARDPGVGWWLPPRSPDPEASLRGVWTASPPRVPRGLPLRVTPA